MEKYSWGPQPESVPAISKSVLAISESVLARSKNSSAPCKLWNLAEEASKLQHRRRLDLSDAVKIILVHFWDAFPDFPKMKGNPKDPWQGFVGFGWILAYLQNCIECESRDQEIYYKYLKWSYNCFLGGMASAMAVFALQGAAADFILEYGLWLKDIIFEEISFTFDGLREVACQISTPCRQKYNL